jgi:hypothetical protein
MAITNRRSGAWASRLYFAIRFLGLSGLMAAAVGAGLVLLDQRTAPAPNLATRAASLWSDVRVGNWDPILEVLTGGDGLLRLLIAYMVLVGGGLALLAVLTVLLSGLRVVTGRRGASGFGVAVQVVLATVLLVGVNVFVFRHPVRLDWTRDQRFHELDKFDTELNGLKQGTTVVVYRRFNSFGAAFETPAAETEDAREVRKRARYEVAAAKKVVEKVRDLVDQLNAAGRHFEVVTLDVEEEDFDDKLDDVARKSKTLAEAIDAAPENSIFFYSKDGRGEDRVQRLGFSELYQLDLARSRAADGGKGNLVLLPQGVEPFANRVLNLDEKKPVIGVAVTHELLTTRGTEDIFTLAGLRKSLTARGFEVRDIILKKWDDFGPPQPAVSTFEEYRSEDLDDQVAAIDTNLQTIRGIIKDNEGVRKDLKTATLDELTKKYRRQLGGKRMTEGIRKNQLEFLESQIDDLQGVVEQLEVERTQAVREKGALPVEGLAEQKRLTDLKAKFDRLLAGCDLLIVPRMTLRNVNLGQTVPPWIHRLDDAQAAAVKDFLRAGKPVLACFGPINEPANAGGPPGERGPDPLENLLSDVGFRFGKQTILYNEEAKALSSRRSSFPGSAGTVKVPALEFGDDGQAAEGVRPNPLTSALRIDEGGLGQGVDPRHPRPITFDPDKAKDLDFDPTFLRTSKKSWNDDNPFPTRERTPHLEQTKPDDPAKGTPDEKRPGPFSVGVAVETPLPAEWYAGSSASPRPVRLAAIGHGHLFTGPELSPARERLLLDTCNWLLGRDDQLPRGDHPWSYPRVSLSERNWQLWNWGMRLGLPILFAYLGVVVLMVRRVR